MIGSLVFQKDSAAPSMEGEAERPELNAGRAFSGLWLHLGWTRWDLPCGQAPRGRGWQSSI